MERTITSGAKQHCAKQHWAIWDNATDVEVSRPHKTCTALKSTIWNMAYIYMCRQSAPLVGAAPDITETVWKPISLQMLKMCSWQNTSSWSRKNGNNYHHTSLSLLLTYEPLLLPRPDLKIPQLWNIRARFTARQMKLGWRPRTAPSQAHRHHYLRGRRTGTTFMLHIAADVILEAMSWIRNKESDVSANSAVRAVDIRVGVAEVLRQRSIDIYCEGAECVIHGF